MKKAGNRKILPDWRLGRTMVLARKAALSGRDLVGIKKFARLEGSSGYNVWSNNVAVRLEDAIPSTNCQTILG